MTETTAEKYRGHSVWQVLKSKELSLKEARFSTEELEEYRTNLLAGIRAALSVKTSASAIDFTQVLTDLQSSLNSLGVDEPTFRNFVGSANLASFWRSVRDLPSAAPAKNQDKYVGALDAALDLRLVTINELSTQLTELRDQIKEASDSLDKIQKVTADLNDQLLIQSSKLNETVSTAALAMDGEWKNRIESWNLERTTKDQTLDGLMATEIAVLSASSELGARLMQNAAGQLTAIEWTRRATRERRTAWGMSLGAFISFSSAIVIGFWYLSNAIVSKADIQLGEGILKSALVLSCVGLGSLFAAEARRHFKEADSAEDVMLSITAMEPFMTGADAKDQKRIRTNVAQTIFVKNVLSRFAGRDSSRNNSINSSDLNELTAEIVRGLAKNSAVSSTSSPTS